MADSQTSPQTNALKSPRKIHSVDYVIFFFFGAITIIIFAVVAIKECLSEPQVRFFQIILAISIGGLVSGVPGFLKVTYKGWIRAGGGMAAFVLILMLKPFSSAASPGCGAFNVTAQIEASNKDSEAIKNALVYLKLGEHRVGPKEINDNKIIFDGIPAEYFDDPIKLLPRDERIVVFEQSHSRAEESKSITFKLRRVIDSTFVSGFVFDAKKRAIENAQVVFDSKFKTLTDKSGFYSIKIPYELGEGVRLLVLINNAKVEDRNQYISANIDVIISNE